MDTWHYETPICSGLGDRLGLVFSLSALASLHGENTTVWMEWCTDSRKVLLNNGLFYQYIPYWTGWQYSLEELRGYMQMPPNVKFFSSDERAPMVPWARSVTTGGGELPGKDGIPQVSTLYWRALKLSGDQRTWTRAQYVQAYKNVPLVPVSEAAFPYVLVHFRGPDRNTHVRDEIHFCTRRVISTLWTTTKAHMRVISNNVSHALKWLDGLPSLEIVHSGNNAFADMQLAMNAAGIVQHASEGWSSFTSVPAMAKSVPLINTYEGEGHRHGGFSHYGGLPEEFHMCGDVVDFAALVSRRIKRLA